MKNTFSDLQKLPKSVIEELQKVSRIAQYLWTREWAERNAGNISINLTDDFEGFDFEKGEEITCSLPKEAANIVLLVTGTGCYLRYLVDRIEEASCILKINADATGYTILWGGKKEGFRPTSELISHVKIHYSNKKINPTHKAVVHCHPIELIVLSHHPIILDEEKTNHALWQMCPEVRVFVPRGVFCAPYALSGSELLADITIEGLKKRDVVIWEKHGALATGEDVEKAFDYLDVANKGAKMLLMAWSANFNPRGLTNEELKELEAFI